jgi:hypothetical protein
MSDNLSRREFGTFLGAAAIAGAVPGAANAAAPSEPSVVLIRETWGRAANPESDERQGRWKHEAMALAKARKGAGYDLYPIPQLERDHIFLQYRPNTSTKACRRPKIVVCGSRSGAYAKLCQSRPTSATVSSRRT